MNKLNALLMIVLVFAAITANANLQKIEYFDSKFYHPEAYGLRDLVFKVRISNLLRMVNEQKIYGNVKDIYFQVFWMYPGKVKIEVYGLPEGFMERKEQLRQMVKARLDFVIPQKISPQLRGYTFKTKPDKQKLIYIGEDKSGKLPQHEVQVVFDNKGRLLNLKTIGTLGVSELKSDLGKMKWSKNTWVLKKLRSEMTNMNNVTTIMDHNFSYLTESGFGFPREIDIKTSYKAPGIKGKSKSVSNKITFSGYQVNTGRAKQTIGQAEKSIQR